MIGLPAGGISMEEVFDGPWVEVDNEMIFMAPANASGTFCKDERFQEV